MFKVERIEYLTAEEMNKHLEVINECYVIVKGPKLDNKPITITSTIKRVVPLGSTLDLV